MTSNEFKGLRKKMGLTQIQLADLMGMPQPSLARIESGARQPTRQHAAHIQAIALLDKKKIGRLEALMITNNSDKSE